MTVKEIIANEFSKDAGRNVLADELQEIPRNPNEVPQWTDLIGPWDEGWWIRLPSGSKLEAYVYGDSITIRKYPWATDEELKEEGFKD